MTTAKDKKQVISLAVPSALKEKLQRHESYTVYAGAVLAAHEGLCPVCHNHWPLKAGLAPLPEATKSDLEKAAGLQLKSPANQILDDIGLVAFKLEKVPTRDEYLAHPERKQSLHSIRQTFGTYAQAVAAFKARRGDK